MKGNKNTMQQVKQRHKTQRNTTQFNIIQNNTVHRVSQGGVMISRILFLIERTFVIPKPCTSVLSSLITTTPSLSTE